MNSHVLRFSLSSHRLKWVLILEIVLIIWGIHTLWQSQLENQQSVTRYQYQEQQWQRLNQTLQQLPQELPVQMLYQNGLVVGIRLQQSMRLTEWRALLEELNERFWLAPTEISWQRDEQQWAADITWQLVRPSILKPEVNLLPFDLKPSWPDQGTLVSTLHGKRSAALIQTDTEEIWRYEGSWLPQLQATLAEVEQEYVVLQNAQGESRRLYLSDVAFTDNLMHEEPLYELGE